MGYHGVPSKACSHCRRRRIKCDLSTPSCGQCVRSDRTCFGYRNQTDLLFHDQSEETACKVRRSKQTSQQTIAESTTKVDRADRYFVDTTSQLDFLDLYLDDSYPTPCALSPSAESLAFCYFVSNYPPQVSKNFDSVYQYIPDLYPSEPSDSPLGCVITAVGLAGLSHHTDTSGLEITAGTWYEKVLHKINSNLQDRELAKLDETLLVVLLLGLYETNICSTPRSMISWLKHIKGATALLDLRGEEQLDTALGRVLFTQTRTQIISGCYQTRSSIPEKVVQLSRICHDKYADPVEDLGLVAFQICNVRSRTPFSPPPTQSSATTRATITKYTSIVQNLSSWHENLLLTLPSRFFPSPIPTESPCPDILSTHHDIYEDIWTAGIANNYHANSILAHEALISQLVFLRDHHPVDLSEVLELDDQIARSRSTILFNIDGVCASVPYLLRTGCAAAGVGLLWALYVSAQTAPRAAPLSRETREWIVGRLERIGAQMGVRQADMLAGYLRRQVQVTDLLTGE